MDFVGGMNRCININFGAQDDGVWNRGMFGWTL